MKKLNTEEFIKKAKNVHGDIYDYSKVKYLNNRTKVKIICPYHGIFEQRPNNHLHGQNCLACSKILAKEKISTTNDNFIIKAKSVHGYRYDYTLVNYINNKTNINIICSNHGKFQQNPNSHLKNRGCPKCVGKNKTNEEFIKEATIVHNNTYDYSLTNYLRSKIKVNIICYKHGLFLQTPDKHLNGNGCPICKSSNGEKIIRKILLECKIKFKEQYKFIDCKLINPLPFDFYLFDFNICIEFQGEQHYKPIDFFGGVENFKKQQKRDNIKKNYCANNNIKLIIIKYNEDIISILEEVDKLKIYISSKINSESII